MMGAMHDLYERHHEGETAVVTLRGELDAHDAPRLRELFAAAVAEVEGSSRPCLVVDLTGVGVFVFLHAWATGGLSNVH